MTTNPPPFPQERYLAGILELLCQNMELTPTQYRDAETKYKAVSNWLAESDDPRLASGLIFPQGSMRLGTTVKPLGRDEFDIDLVAQLGYAQNDSPNEVYIAVGNRLRANATYKELLEPKNRCWRLNYAESSGLHMDITPAIHNASCTNGGLLVPDRKLSDWSPSNPAGYADWFEERAKLQPTMLFVETVTLRADVAPLPEQIKLKGPLKRIVQLCKRHRDLMFAHDTHGNAPISIIMTTLAAHAYEQLTRTNRFNNEYELVAAVIKAMPDFIEIDESSGQRTYVICNPSTDGENFAERWNNHPERARAFYRWHGRMMADLDKLMETHGVDGVVRYLGEHITGTRDAGKVANLVTERVTAAREKGLLKSGAIGLGLTTGRTVQGNTFFGM